MDNASKALIMAGAILIAVAIVGIGIYIFSSANSMTDDALSQIDALTVTSINSQLQQYAGEIRGRELKQLINTARSINLQNTLPDNGKISLSCGSNTNATILTADLTSDIQDNLTYEVKFTYSAAGYINHIDASVKGSSK